MCILFFYLNSISTSKYKLILASNRDEVLSRPAKESHFWANNPSCLGGQDLVEGKEGGTWLAMNTSGQIAVLLNIMQLKKELLLDSNSKGRGSLVSDFICNREDAKSYFLKIDKEKELYNKFHLITLAFKDGTTWEGFHYSNMMDTPHQLQDGIHGFTNNLPQLSWNKVEYGKSKFSEIIDKHSELTDKNILIDDLLKLLNDDTQHWPDEGILSQGNDRPVVFLQCLSSVCVKLYERGYGTRVNTIILVDQEGNVDFIENNLQVENKEMKWNVKKFYFPLERR